MFQHQNVVNNLTYLSLSASICLGEVPGLKGMSMLGVLMLAEATIRISRNRGIPAHMLQFKPVMWIPISTDPRYGRPNPVLKIAENALMSQNLKKKFNNSKKKSYIYKLTL